MNVLLLGGTAEARELAAVLADQAVDVVTSLSGSLDSPRLPHGKVRSGGFGGADGLADYLREAGISAVVDATHPFADRISANASAACHASGVPLLRLVRPSWAARPDAAGWHWVDDLAAARQRAGELGERVFLAVGRQSLAAFAGFDPVLVLTRVIDPPDLDLPAGWQLIQARGPFALADELALLREHRIEVLVTKDSGGPTEAKLDAAAQLGVAVVMVRRPAEPAEVPRVEAVGAVLVWLDGLPDSGIGVRIG